MIHSILGLWTGVDKWLFWWKRVPTRSAATVAQPWRSLRRGFHLFARSRLKVNNFERQLGFLVVISKKTNKKTAWLLIFDASIYQSQSLRDGKSNRPKRAVNFWVNFTKTKFAWIFGNWQEIEFQISWNCVSAIKVIFPVLDGTNLILSWIKIHQQKDAGQLWSVTIALEMKFLFPDSVSMIVLHLVSCGLVIGLVWWPFISCTFWARLIVFHNWFLLSVYIFSLFGLFVGTVNKCWMCATLVNLTYIYVLSLWILY